MINLDNHSKEFPKTKRLFLILKSHNHHSKEKDLIQMGEKKFLN